MGTGATSPVLVGRETELERILDAVAEAAAGRPRIVVVAGEAGIGKTRLVREAADVATSQGARIVVGGCLDVGENGLPFLPLAEALRRLSRDASRSELEAILGPARNDVAAIVPELAIDEATAPLDPASGVAQARLFERLLGVFGRLAPPDRSAVVVIEDVQWIDRATQDLVTFLARNLVSERIAIVLTIRTDGLRPGAPVLAWLAGLGRSGGTVRIELERLPRAGVARQLQLIGGGRLPSATVEWIWSRSEGNPLFVEELFASGTEAAAGVTTLAQFLLARLGGLPDAERRVLAVAAVAGRPVDEALLAAALEWNEGAVVEALREPLDRGLLVVDADERYRFRHELMREAVERGLLPGERRALHERLARLLESRPELGDPSPAGAAGQIAHHWASAGREPEAYRASVAAATAAEAVHAYADAHRHFESALAIEPRLPVDVQPTDDERRALRARAADVADLAGEPKRARALIGEALALVDPAADPAAAGILHGRLGFLRWATGDADGGIAAHREAVRLVPAEPPTAERARVLGGLGGALMVAGQWAESRRMCEAAIDCAVRAGARREESRARNMLGSDLVQSGDLDGGITELRRACQIANEISNAEHEIVGRYNLGLNLIEADRLDEALAEARRGAEVARREGLERRYGMDLAALVTDVLIRLGRWDEADAASRAGLALDPDDRGSVYLAVIRARLDALRGDTDEAGRRLESIEREALDPHIGAYVASVRAEAALASGQPQAAIRAVSVGVRSLADVEEVLWTAPLVALGLRATADAAEMARARRTTRPSEDESASEMLRDRLASLAGRCATDSCRAAVAQAEAEVARADGTATPEAWREVAAAWERVPDPWAAAYTRLRAVEAELRRSGLRAAVRTELAAVHEAAIALGARPLATQAAALAARARLSLAPPTGSPAVAVAADAGPESQGEPDRALSALGLSARELEVLALVAEGLSNGQIAERLFISRKTASVHVTHILDKLGVANRVEAAMIAARAGLVD